MCLHPRTRLTPEDACDDENSDNGGADAPFRGIAAGPQAYWRLCLRPISEWTNFAWNEWTRNWMVRWTIPLPPSTTSALSLLVDSLVVPRWLPPAVPTSSASSER